MPKDNNLSAFENWSNKAKELSHIANFQVSDLLERKATAKEREQGLDIADFLIKYKIKDFNRNETLNQPVRNEPEKTKIEAESIQTPTFPDFKRESKKETIQTESWTTEIKQLEEFFATVSLPTKPIKLNRAETILNLPKFIEGHMDIIKRNNGNKTFLPYLERLQKIAKAIA